MLELHLGEESRAGGRMEEWVGGLNLGRIAIADVQNRVSLIIVRLNYYRLEAGRFEDFVSYGLKSFAHDGVT